MTKQEKLEEITKHIEGYNAGIEKGERLLEALYKWENKNIDKRFFEKYFTTKGEFRDWTEFSIMPKRWEWSKHNHELRISNNLTLELDNRTKAHIEQKLKEGIDKVKDWRDERVKTRDEIKAIDEDRLKNDLLDLCHKYNAYKLWTDILENYDVKYPKKN